MIGAIIGDIIGSPYEFKNSLKTKKFDLYHKNIKFTDDTVLTIATADAILNKKSYVETYNEWGNKYPNAGYGSSFKNWLASTVKTPYNSWGNGSAMKISPIGWLFNDL